MYLWAALMADPAALRVYFYPHAYLRDRQIDTIRNWPRELVVNPDVISGRTGAQVSRGKALGKARLSWVQRLPLLNVKLRPRGAGQSVVYVWGAIIATGPFVVELDNPFALTGYNISAMPLYRPFLRRVLMSSRCVGIVCMSEASRQTLRRLFGEEVYARSSVRYPLMERRADKVTRGDPETRFLFVGTQFEIKGGAAMLRAFERAYQEDARIRLDVVTHLPPELEEISSRCPGIHIHSARYSRDEIFNQFMRNAHVLVHPTYVESFGMVVLEALAHGLAVIATDVYAIQEMVIDGRNGILLKPPISIWDDYLPSRVYREWTNLTENVRSTDTSGFEDELRQAFLRFSGNHGWRDDAREESLRLIDTTFSAARRR